MPDNSKEDVRWLLVIDVDDTRLNDHTALSEFLGPYRQAPNLFLTINSSRPTASVLRALRALPFGFQPDAIIAAMGTEITVNGRRDIAWEQRFVGFDRTSIDAVMQQRGFESLDDEFQTPYKASYIVSKGAELVLATISVEGLEMPLQIVRLGGSGFDVIPHLAGREAATIHLATSFGVSPERVIVSGDLAN